LLLLLLLCPADAGQGMHHVAESSAHHQQGEQQQLCHYSAVLHAVRTVHDTKPAAAQQLAMSLSNAGKVTKSDYFPCSMMQVHQPGLVYEVACIACVHRWTSSIIAAITCAGFLHHDLLPMV
jgi:hypothetical protein